MNKEGNEERLLPITELSPEAFAPFGWILGKPYRDGDERPGYCHATSDFWHEHSFDTGPGGEIEVLWVNYRNDSMKVLALEAHWLTQQAIVPLGGAEIVHVVAPDDPASPGHPDLKHMKVFCVGDNRGICMKPGVWHTSFVRQGQTTCLMLTRRSTTLDLIDQLRHQQPGSETSVVNIKGLTPFSVRVQL